MSLEKPKPTIEVIVIQLKQKGKNSRSFTVYGISLENAFRRVKRVFRKLINKKSNYIFDAKKFYEEVKRKEITFNKKELLKNTEFWNEKMSREVIFQKMQSLLDVLKKILETPIDGLLPNSTYSSVDSMMRVMYTMVVLGALCEKLMEMEKKE